MAGFEGNSLSGVLGTGAGLGLSALVPGVGSILAGVGALSGLLGGGGSTKVSVNTEQAVSQVVGVSTSPSIVVSSPSATVQPTSGEASPTGSPITLSTPVTQEDTRTGLLPSIGIPSSDVSGNLPTLTNSAASSGSFSLGDPMTLLLLAGAAFAIYYMVK